MHRGMREPCHHHIRIDYKHITNRKDTHMANRKLGWTTVAKALEESRKHTHTAGYVKLSDGSFGALVRITFAADYSTSSREYVLRDGGWWMGDTLIDRGMVDAAPGWQAEARTRVRAVAS